MGAPIQFNVTNFRAMFQAFSDAGAYPDATLTLYWGNAAAYITDCPQYSRDGLNLSQQTLALNLMTAHIAQLMTLANAGQITGNLTGATIDKVNVQLQPPPAPNEWQFWLNQTPYGQQLLSLLEVAGAGGFFAGGYPTTFTLRR